MTEPRRRGGDAVISLPRWAWSILTSLMALLLTGAMAWATWMSTAITELKTNLVDRKEIQSMIENNAPYVRERATIEARLLTAEKAVERHENDGRRFSETMARVEAKLDLIIPKKVQP